MTNSSLLPATAKLIQSDFRLSEDDGFPVDQSVQFEQLHAALSQRISYMIDHDFEFLMQALYRIDVNELRVQKVFSGDGDNPADELATLIIERELKKAETRMKYSNRTSNP